jgi:integrase
MGSGKGFQIQFAQPDGSRASIRLGPVSKRQAENVKWFVEDLVAARDTKTTPSPTTTEWVGTAPNTIRERIERVGLVEPRERRVIPTLGEWIDTYIGGRTDIKPRTLINMNQTRADLLQYFTAKKPLDRVTPGDAEDFHTWLKMERGLGEGTIRRECKRVKQFFNAAIKHRILTENPFAGIKCGPYANPGRFYFVTRKEAEAVLRACRHAEWRLIFALCRYGGLRCPSEVLTLRWDDVDWEKMRFTVRATKTEHHSGGGLRLVPIFPELLPYLREVFEQAEPGTEYVITRYRQSHQNLRTTLSKIIRRAGLEPWPKLYQNLRSTRETELAETFPLHVVCTWIGNSEPVATKHYLQVTEEHFRLAAVQAPAPAAPEPQPALPADLARNWAGLPESVRAAILALVGRTPEAAVSS